MKKPNAYIRFIKLVESLNLKSNIRKLDPIEIRLMDSIMIDEEEGRSSFVKDILGLKALGSQATLHGRVKNLRHLGYIELITQADARRKRVMLTRQGYQRFELLADCMEQALHMPT